MRRLLQIAAIGALTLAAALYAASRREEPARPAGFIDAHAHVVRRGAAPPLDVNDAQALETMDAFGVERAIVLPPPFPILHERSFGAKELRALAEAHPDRFAFVAGGESLNPMLQATPPEAVTPEALAAFEREAEAIADAGAIGFGEFALEHFPRGTPGHPYEAAPPDHPFLLALADLAARRSMPIDVHMEAVSRDQPFPEHRKRGPVPYPKEIRENLSRFERLLEHNRQARIVWAHAGWDLTGERTPEVMRRLLARHPNLFMSVKLDDLGAQNDWPLAPGGTSLLEDWLQLFRDFPDRFVIGSDQFFDGGTTRVGYARQFFKALPPHLARKLASENAHGLYRLPQKWR